MSPRDWSQFNFGKTGTIFPWFPLTKWFVKNLGLISFVKNLDYFLLLQIEGLFSLFIDIFKSELNLNKSKFNNLSNSRDKHE